MIDSKDMKLGAYAGLTGAVVFGAIMAIMGTLPTGLLVYLVVSAVIGVLGTGYLWLRRRSKAREAAGPPVGTLAELCMYNALSKDTNLGRKEL